jgi:hypothetical protein
MQQAADQCRLAVIDLADDDDTHQGARGGGRGSVESMGDLNVHVDFFSEFGGSRTEHRHR